MKPIQIPSILNDEAFEEISRYWNSTEQPILAIPTSITIKQAEEMTRYLLTKLPGEVAFGLLADIAELPELSQDILEQIFERGDTACRVAVCSRTDLSNHLEVKCGSSTDPDVQDHLAARLDRKRKF